ncbi:MAG: hypothetical protein KA735_01795 [Burkholderiaceae bacterium]|nr:hypothetical protein [Burkholderiaceae bacterium]
MSNTTAPTLAFNFAKDGKRPDKFPQTPVFPTGFVPNTGDGITFPGSDDIYVVVSRVFSFNDQGAASIFLNMALAGATPDASR